MRDKPDAQHDAPIAAGDLVVVVKPSPCCGNESTIGLHFIVKEVRLAKGRYHCSRCDTNYPTEIVAVQEEPWAYQLWRLKRIPPLSEMESEKTKEDISEPA